MNFKQMTKIKDKETMIKELADLLALLPDEEVAWMYLYINTWYLKSVVQSIPILTDTEMVVEILTTMHKKGTVPIQLDDALKRGVLIRSNGDKIGNTDFRKLHNLQVNIQPR